MHGNELHPEGLRAAGELGCAQAVLIPAQTHFQGHRQAHRAHHGRNQPLRMIEVAHQGRARLFAGHLSRRATHIDVDDIGTIGRRHTGALGHPVGFTAGKLHDLRGNRSRFQPAPGAVPIAHEVFACHHLGDHPPGTEAVRELAEGQVGDAGHGRQHDVARHRVGTEAKAWQGRGRWGACIAHLLGR